MGRDLRNKSMGSEVWTGMKYGVDQVWTRSAPEVTAIDPIDLYARMASQ